MTSSATHWDLQSCAADWVGALKHAKQHFACQTPRLCRHGNAVCKLLPCVSGGSSQWPVEGTVDLAHMETPVSGPAEGSGSEASFNCSYWSCTVGPFLFPSCCQTVTFLSRHRSLGFTCTWCLLLTCFWYSSYKCFFYRKKCAFCKKRFLQFKYFWFWYNASKNMGKYFIIYLLSPRWSLCKVWFCNDHVRKIFSAKCSKSKLKLSIGNKPSFNFTIHFIEKQNWQRVKFVLHESRNEKIF